MRQKAMKCQQVVYCWVHLWPIRCQMVQDVPEEAVVRLAMSEDLATALQMLGARPK